MISRAAMLLNESQVEEISVDASPMSPFTHQALGGRPTIMGSWNGGVVLLGRAEPADNAVDIDETLLRQDRRESGPLKGPLLLTRCDGPNVLDFSSVDYVRWLQNAEPLESDSSPSDSSESDSSPSDSSESDFSES